MGRHGVLGVLEVVGVGCLALVLRVLSSLHLLRRKRPTPDEILRALRQVGHAALVRSLGTLHAETGALMTEPDRAGGGRETAIAVLQVVVRRRGAVNHALAVVPHATLAEVAVASIAHGILGEAAGMPEVDGRQRLSAAVRDIGGHVDVVVGVGAGDGVLGAVERRPALDGTTLVRGDVFVGFGHLIHGIVLLLEPNLAIVVLRSRSVERRGRAGERALKSRLGLGERNRIVRARRGEGRRRTIGSPRA